MSVTDNTTWLRDYAETGSEQAFGQLVARHFDLVHATALRMVCGDTQLAQDIAQTVFTDLARQARNLPRNLVLGGWLYRHTWFTATKAIRAERRRRMRESRAVEMKEQNESPDEVWHQIAPVLEEAMGHLSTRERDAVVLRFFEHQPFRAVGGALGTTEEGARRRVDRALEKLRRFFAGRGVSLSLTALATLLGGPAVTSAPAGLAALVAGASLSSAVTGGGLTLWSIKLLIMTKMKIMAAATAGILVVACPTALQYQANVKLREENRTLREQTARTGEPDESRAEKARLANPSTDTNQNQFRELLRLRGEVSSLRKQVAEMTRQGKVQEPTGAETDTPAEAENPALAEEKRQAIQKMNDATGWLRAFIMFASENNNKLPPGFTQASAFTSEDTRARLNQAAEQFEIVSAGTLWGNTNPPPEKTILIREKQAWQSVNGKWARTYGFADGHSEVHSSPDGDFGPWESERMPQPRQ